MLLLDSEEPQPSQSCDIWATTTFLTTTFLAKPAFYLCLSTRLAIEIGNIANGFSIIIQYFGAKLL